MQILQYLILQTRLLLIAGFGLSFQLLLKNFNIQFVFVQYCNKNKFHES